MTTMKTAKQWAVRVQNSKEPWEKLVLEIQNDALQYAAAICIDHSKNGNPEGWTDIVSRECAHLIGEKIELNSRRVDTPDVCPVCGHIPINCDCDRGQHST